MKKNLFIINIVAAVFVSLLLVNVGSGGCASQRDGLSNVRSQANGRDTRLTKSSDPDWQGDKSQRFKELEWLILQNIIKQYEKIEVVDDREDNLD